jgi:antitoxin ParD1/3/4
MPSEAKLSVTLTEEMAAMIGRAVESGDYASASEVVREALRTWKLQRGQAEQERVLLRDVIARSIASGNVGEVSAETIKAEGRALLAARRSAEKAKT